MNLSKVRCSKCKVEKEESSLFFYKDKVKKNGLGRVHLDWSSVHLDHIIPLNGASTEEEVLKLNHYTNLQLLFAEDNMDKGSKLNWSL